MREVVQYAAWAIGLPLELLIIGVLLRGHYRRFPLVLVYSIALFLTTVIEISVNQAYFSGIRFSHSRATYYWVDEAIRQGLQFAVVLNLAYLATTNLRSRNLVRVALIAGGITIALASFLAHREGHLAAEVGRWRWMTLWVRDIDFAAAILDLALWSFLLVFRPKGTQLLLMLSGGLGVQFAGEAIGESLRFLLRRWSLPFSPGDIVTVATSLAGLWIWWQVLRRPVSLTAPAGVALPPRRDETEVAK
jgi:hypothetical protein